MINVVALILIFVSGAVIMIASIFNWKIFFDNKKGDYFSERWGPNATRVAYFIIGILIIGMGIYAYYNGLLDPES
jgi:hypothetical protein